MRLAAAFAAAMLACVPWVALAPTAAADGPWACPAPALGGGVAIGVATVGACMTPCNGIGGDVEVVHDGVPLILEPRTPKVCVKAYPCRPPEGDFGLGVWVEKDDVPVAGVKVCVLPCPAPSLGYVVTVGAFVDPAYPQPTSVSACVTPTDCPATYGPGYNGTGIFPADLCVDPTACGTGIGVGVDGIPLCLATTDCAAAYGAAYVGTGVEGIDACVDPGPACPDSVLGFPLGVRVNGGPPVCLP